MVSLLSFVPPKTMLASFHSFPSSFVFQTLKPTKPSYLTLSPKTLTWQSSPKPKRRATVNANKPTSKNRKKPSYGTSRRSVIKKTFKQEQVMFTTPVPDDPLVAVIGGGMSGLICAKHLEKRGVRSTVFDTACMVNVVRPCWISKLEPFNGMWHLSENGKPRGEFDAIVIAHNGKCANRLLASSGLPLIARQMKRLELSSIWALLAAFEDPLPIPGGTSFEGAFVKGINSLSWMANNNKKLLRSQSSGPHCWTFFSTAAYGKQNKVPQENIPTVTAEKVKAGMLEGVEAALGLPKGSLTKPFYTRVQLWGAALPTNTPGVPCIFDPHGRAGICGDWLLGSSLESAALSGMTLANHIADYFQTGGARPEEFAIGLHNEFQPLEGHDIGQFPGVESEKEINEAQAYQLAS
ncbi:uncharacterized protein LOC133883078 isoform X2 [Alnus glutinosa]|uniref:uncharacterized protein LOC133883078 isoform X2 n=1 Tax=Alnus glutinosa TaxID=3517 RepID=UPI002D79734E|nr:uncharacterized protein LOC133883078 isoform X2 [Alnus glutinosa]